MVGAVCPFSLLIPEELEAYVLKTCYELIKLPINPERILVSREIINPPFWAKTLPLPSRPTFGLLSFLK
jgi:hypothetical protein